MGAGAWPRTRVATARAVLQVGAMEAVNRLFQTSRALIFFGPSGWTMNLRTIASCGILSLFLRMIWKNLINSE